MGIGIDIVEIDRIEKACRRKSFTVRFFTEREISSIRQGPQFYAHIAGKFAAKEAVSKALGTGFRFCWHDIEILNDESGKPMVHLSGKALDISKTMNIDEILLVFPIQKISVAFAIARPADRLF